jgi:hypothetical protein
MKSHELRELIPNLLSEAGVATDIAKTAEKNRKSLGGHGPYADRFHAAVVPLTTTEKKIRPHLAGVALTADELDQFGKSLSSLKDPAIKVKDRTAALRTLRMLCETVILHKIDGMAVSPVPTTEPVLPLDVVRNTRSYLTPIVIQANGCYERTWFDACSVMIRKLAEVLIIAVFEKKAALDEIRKQDGGLAGLQELIGKIKAHPEWNLDRATGPCLDKMKELGDRSAHKRHYVATKQDVDGILLNLRVAIDDLIHLAGYRDSKAG